MFDAKKNVLDNGIKLITIKKDTQMMSIHMGIKIGAIYEGKNEKGISHFIEHMLFKGTSSRNNEVLNKELEALGGEYNAYTDNSSTVFSITALKDEVEKSIELLSDMLKNSILDEKEIEKEREVILAEIRSCKDDIEDFSFKKTNEAAFKDSPLRYDILGNENTVKSFDKNELKNFYEKYYVPNNSYIAIVSPFPHEYVIDLVKKYFKEWIYKEFNRNTVLEECNIPINKISYRKDIEQSTIVYLFTFYGLDKKEELALKILSYKLGESSNSILFRELREKRGFAYDIYTDLDLSAHVKTFYIYTSISKENLDSAIEVIDECINNIKERKIRFEKDTIDLMKKTLKTAIAFTLEDVTDLGNYALHQSIDGEDLFQFYKDIEDLNNMEKEDIYKIASKVLRNPTIHVLLNN
ncbi:M16 family metallopeptidase [Clostridium niameyense]|uniref:M16 family metallopeptidase n=1 Tax=Clostridium niameyense TaxID=1622073 RepID=UPI00067EFA25|nr:pitrilysin family protein [Clostridium niameyense]